jgi:hypothetical protein
VVREHAQGIRARARPACPHVEVEEVDLRGHEASLPEPKEIGEQAIAGFLRARQRPIG